MTKDQIIIAAAVVQDENDVHQFRPMLQKAIGARLELYLQMLAAGVRPTPRTAHINNERL